MLNQVQVNKDNIPFLTEESLIVEQGEGKFLSSPSSVLTTLGLTTCLGVALISQNDSGKKVYLMHLDRFSHCFPILKKAYEEFSEPPKLLFFANRHHFTGEIKDFGNYSILDDSLDTSLLAASLTETSALTIGIEEITKTLSCSSEEIGRIIQEIPGISICYLTDIIEQNAKMRAILYHLQRSDAELINVPCGNVSIDDSNIYVDHNFYLSDIFEDSTSESSTTSSTDSSTVESPNFFRNNKRPRVLLNNTEETFRKNL